MALIMLETTGDRQENYFTFDPIKVPTIPRRLIPSFLPEQHAIAVVHVAVSRQLQIVPAYLAHERQVTLGPFWVRLRVGKCEGIFSFTKKGVTVRPGYLERPKVGCIQWECMCHDNIYAQP